MTEPAACKRGIDTWTDNFGFGNFFFSCGSFKSLKIWLYVLHTSFGPRGHHGNISEGGRGCG
jgi:hypothetical protein